MNPFKTLAAVALLSAILSPRLASAQDHPLVPVYPNATLEDRKLIEFDEFKFPVARMWDNKFTKELTLEGKITSLRYKYPEERSTLEIYRNYEKALKQSGFETLFTCSKEECGKGDTETKVGHYAPYYDTRFFSVKMARPEGDVYAAVNISGYYHKIWITVVELKPMDESMSGRKPAASAEPAPSRTPAVAEATAPSRPVPAGRTPYAKGATTSVLTGVVKGLAAFGIQAKPGSASSAADIIVDGEVETNPFQGNDARIKWARSKATIALKDGQTQNIFAQFDVTDKQGSGDYNEAVRRVHAELGKKVAAQVNAEIANYFENQ